MVRSAIYFIFQKSHFSEIIFLFGTILAINSYYISKHR